MYGSELPTALSSTTPQFFQPLLTHRQHIGNKEDIALLKRVSLVVWQHINLHGRYEFTKSQDIIDMQEIIRELVKSSVKGKWAYRF